MSQRIADTTLTQLSDLVARQLGLLFPRERWRELERGIVAAAPKLGCSDASECVRRLMSAPLTRPQVEILAGFLAVGESYFLRDPGALTVAETEILPELIRSRRGRDQRLRIWSAGCSTGEEAYSLAILLRRLLPDLERWNVTILATDINTGALRQGMDGVYGKWSFRGTPHWFKSLYFSPEEEGRYRIKEEIRRLVSFQFLNLAEDSYPSLFTNTTAMDLIFCRNVLMYFTREMVRTVVAKLQRSLANDGWLVVGPVESWPGCYQPLEAVRFGTVTCYRKRGADAPSAQQEGEAEGAPQPAAQAPLQPQQEPASVGEVAPPPDEPSYEAAARLYRQGRYPETVALLTELSQRVALPVAAAIMLIRSHANQGELSEALHLSREALESHRLDATLHHLHAEILQEEGRFDEARVSLERAVFLDPKLVLAHFALGNLALWAGKPDKARRHMTNALELLREFAPEELLPGSEGMSAGRLSEIITQIMTGPSPPLRRAS